jgi:hypothetical protein
VIKLIFLFGAGLMTLAGLSESLILSLPDTRVVATPFLEKQGIVEAKSYCDGFSPFSPRDFPPDRRPNLSELANYRYAIFSSYQYQLFFDNPQRSPDQVNFYKQIRQNAKLLMEYRPFTANTIYDQWLLLKHVIRQSLFKQEPAAYYTGPVLQIYQLADQ